MRPKLMPVLVLVVLAAVMAAPATARKTHQITAGGGPFGPTWQWQPAELEVAAGDRVTWTNPTGTTHHVTGWEGEWDVRLHVSADGKASHRFRSPGVYRYRCDIPMHSQLIGGVCIGQCGTITVR